MAQTRRRRRRKHRGTQSGTIDRRSRGRPRSRQEARARARSQLSTKRDQRPTWRSAFNRALFAGVLVVAFLTLIAKESPAAAVGFAAAMVLIYIPIGYYLDLFLYNRRRAIAARRREGEERR